MAREDESERKAKKVVFFLKLDAYLIGALNIRDGLAFA